MNKWKLDYLNVVLSIIAALLTIIILQNANIIQPVNASSVQSTVDVNVSEIGGVSVFPYVGSNFQHGIPVYIVGAE